MNWSDEKIEEMKAMILAGSSAGVIALALGTTRSAVIGKCKRKGIALNAHASVVRNRSVSTMTAIPRDPFKPVVLPGSRFVTLESIERGACRYPVDDGPEFHFCGLPGFPWCPEHHAVCFQKAKR